MEELFLLENPLDVDELENPVDDISADELEDLRLRYGGDYDVGEPRRPTRRRNPVRRVDRTSGIDYANWILLGVGGYLAWCWWKSRNTATWTWTPWKTTIAAIHPVVGPAVSQPQPSFLNGIRHTGVTNVGTILSTATPTLYPARSYDPISVIVP